MKAASIPWGTRIELVEDPDRLGFHHIHLASASPDATLTWYRTMFGGEPASLKGRQNGLKFGDVWLLVSQHETSAPPSNSKGRSIDHVAFVAKEFDKTVADLQQRKVAFLEPAPQADARPQSTPCSAVRTTSASKSSSLVSWM